MTFGTNLVGQEPWELRGANDGRLRSLETRYLAGMARSANLAVGGPFVATAILMDTLDYADNPGVFVGGVYQCLADGVYDVRVGVQLDSAPANWSLQIVGTNSYGKEGVNSTGLGAAFSTLIPARVGNTFQAQVYNNGAATNVREGGFFTWMVVQRTGPYPGG